MIRKRILQLRSKRRWPAGRFSSSTNMKSLERLVLSDQRRYANRFGDGFLRNAAFPFTPDLLPAQPVFKLLED